LIETIWQALSFDGLPILIVAVFLAGLVRGFAGFGTAMVFVPIAATVTNPIWAILMMMCFDLFGPLALLPRAWRDGEPKDVSLLGLGALFGIPVGLYFLTQMDPDTFRWIVSCLALLMLVVLASGWRYQTPLNAMKTTFLGLVSGFLMGVAALPGPPVIVSYMSSSRAVSVVRANTMMFLFLVDILAFFIFWIKGLLVLLPLLVGLLLSVPYAIAGLIGQGIFNPDKEHIYRRVAYALIATSAVFGMPIWD